MKRIRLAVISDIHAGDGARAKDLCPEGSPGRDKKPDDNYIEKFLQFLKASNLEADYLLLPGDVTDRAKPNEVQVASNFIARVCEVLNLGLDRVLFVPGNHDVDWSVIDPTDTTGVRRAQRYVPIQAEKFCFGAIVAQGEGCVFEAPHFTVWSRPDLLVIGYNSSHHDEPAKFHHGLLDASHYEEMRAALAKLPASREQLRVFLIHHHMRQYDDPTPDSPDASIMVNAEKLQSLLLEFGFDLMVHGHRHLPRFTTHSLNGAPEVAVLSSGSFSVEIDTRWTGTINNQFHLITVDGRDAAEQLILGRVESWSYNYVRGWSKSDGEHDGIPHVEPFGSYIRPEALKALVRPLLEGHFYSRHYVEWSAIAIQEPRLKHLRPQVVVRLLDELAPQLGFKRHHDTPEKMVLLKIE